MFKLWRDARHGLRASLRARGMTALAVLAFALGIGVTTAVFSLFYGVLLKPLPYPDPDQLVLVYGTQPACRTCPASFEEYVDWRTRNKVFQAIGGSWNTQAVVTGLGEPQRVSTIHATASLAGVFRVQPAMGRWFTEAEDQPDAPKVVVLSDRFWRRSFDADPHVIGRTMTIDGEPATVIGVMPATFVHRGGDLFMPVAKAYTPNNRGSHFLVTYARLKPGVSAAQAQREMVALGGTLAREFGGNHGIDVQSYREAIVGSIRQPVWVLMGAVCLVLLIACANVANLLLASGLARRRELAVRSALGATRADLARQLTVESVVLSVAGGLLGLGLAIWAVEAFGAMARDTLPRTSALSIDLPVLLFALLVSLVTGVVCGLWPVLRLGARALAQAIREDSRSGLGGGRRFGNGLVVVEIAVAFCLLVGAGLLVKSLVALERRDMGFSPEGVVAFDVGLDGARYQDDAPVGAFYDQLLPRLRAIPGVVDAGLTSHLPMYAYGWNGEVALEDGNPWKPTEAPLVEDRWIGGDYFKAMNIRLVRGRMFDDRDKAGGTLVTIINQRTAAKFWPGQNPIGKRFSKGGGNRWLEVVGVIADVRSYGLERPAPYTLYTPIAQSEFGPMTVVLKTRSGDPATVMPAARRAVAAVDPLIPVTHVQTMAEVVSASVGQPRLLSSLTVFFGALAGILAAVGVYGVMAYNVRRERCEFGIRLALGADPGRVRGLIVLRGLVLGVLGVGIGAGGALLLTRTLRALLSDVAATDPQVYVGTGVALLVVSVLAVYWPARQAARTDPMAVMRAE
jgi:putative ABC transport system permease protein